VQNVEKIALFLSKVYFSVVDPDPDCIRIQWIFGSRSGSSGKKQRKFKKFIFNISIHFFSLWQKCSLCSCWPGTWQFFNLKKNSYRYWYIAGISSYSQCCQTAAYTDILLQSSGKLFFKVATVSAKNSIKRAKLSWNHFWRIESCKLAIRKKFKVGSGSESGLSKNAGSGLN
jgi:hypothetical protein